MSYYIIIRGPLGSGKTTIAEKLAKKLGAAVYHIDEVLYEHGLDRPPLDASCIPAENFIKANEVILGSAKDILEKGNIVIFDGNFYQKEALEHLIQNLPFQSVVFTLKVPLNICIERDRKRGHSYGVDSARAVFGLVSRFDYGVNINASGDLGTTLEDMSKQLPKP